MQQIVEDEDEDASVVAAPGDRAGVQSERGVRGRGARLPQAGARHRQPLHQEQCCKRSIGEVVQSRRSPLLGSSPG